MDRVELMHKSAKGEVLTEEEEIQLQRYLAEMMEKTQIEYKEIEKIMWRGVKRADRRPAGPVRTTPKIGRNSVCTCEAGSLTNIKYKKCCGK